MIDKCPRRGLPSHPMSVGSNGNDDGGDGRGGWIRIWATVSQIMSSACRCHVVHLPNVEATLLRAFADVTG